MKTTVEKIQDLNLTALEADFLSTLIDNLYAEPGYSDLGVEDIILNMDAKISTKQARGVASSLVKKGIIYIDTPTDYPVVYLCLDHYFLHPEWSR